MKKSGSGQYAIEYLMSYGWAILILLAVAAILFYFGVLNPKIPIAPSCFFGPEMGCYGFSMNTTGHLALDVSQSTGHPISITAMKCTQENNPSLTTVSYTVGDGGHAFLTDGTQKCYLADGTTVATGQVGDVYKGKIYVKYTELDTGFVHVVSGDVVIKF